MPTLPKLFVTRKLPDEVENRLAKTFDVTFNKQDKTLSQQQIQEMSVDHDAILTSPTEIFNSSFFENIPHSIKIISTFSVGYDHIDLVAAKNKNIIITNTPDAVTNATADITFLCILGAARMAQNAEKTLRDGKWDRWGPTNLLGSDVTGKKLGIIGMGGIGKAVAKRAIGFDMEIHYHNRKPASDINALNAQYYDNLHDLLSNVDIISINCPLTEETRHLMNKNTLQSLRDGTILINTARGPILNDLDVIHALKNGKLSAVGLDVFDGEPNNINPEYFKLENAFLLPHIGTATIETRVAMGMQCLENLSAYFAGQNIPNQL